MALDEEVEAFPSHLIRYFFQSIGITLSALARASSRKTFSENMEEDSKIISTICDALRGQISIDQD